jgi:glyoxylase-like metal-dependent hydrolase (beta-lactamase superfamily II)
MSRRSNHKSSKHLQHPLGSNEQEWQSYADQIQCWDAAGPASIDARVVRVPPGCPFSIRPMNVESSLFLIREKDKYGEYPNIYAKIVSSDHHKSHPVGIGDPLMIVLCDTGCGTNIELRGSHRYNETQKVWNLGSFLEATINPRNTLPYMVITSHCHYDHILGIKNLDLKKCTILSSAYDKSFITPRSHLAEHSICNDLGIPPPKYNVGIWAEDFQQIVLTPPGGFQRISTGITILHTPGHTPDSLSWYDSTLSPPQIFIGDSLYERQSKDTKDAVWGREPPMPTIFNVDSNLADWQGSMRKVLKFIRERNRELALTTSEAEIDEWILVSQPSNQHCKSPRVLLSAAHVTVGVDAEHCVFAMMDFMQRIIENKVPHCRVENEKGHEVWLWDDVLDTGYINSLEDGFGRFSVRAPLFVIEKQRIQTKEDTSDRSGVDEDGSEL